jgi:hypothetical protein
VKPEGKRQLERPRHRWEGTIKMYFQRVGWGINWIELAQNNDKVAGAHVNVVMKLWVP